MKKSLLIFICGMFMHTAFSSVVYDTIFINKGQFTTIDTNYFAYYAFNDSNTFNATNSRIEVGIGDSLYLSIINTDIIQHGFDVTNSTGYSNLINPNDTVEVAMHFPNFGMHIMYDDLNYPNFRYMGLGAMIVVDDFAGSRFYWNIKEHQTGWNDSLDNGWTVDWNDYYPDYFTLNGFSNPLINDDVFARVTGSVGDTIRIYISNSGQAIHSLHFHGYHLTILNYSGNQNHTGRSKDTFPVKSMETLILELVPDKPGEYPVHDHNLVAVTGGNIYPSGMFLTMLIP